MKKKILIIGSGAREHAIGWKLRQSKSVGYIYFAPGNAGTNEIGTNVNIKVDEIEKLLTFVQDKQIDMTVVGPELPLSLGIVDLFGKNGLVIFGPKQFAAQLETSKIFSAEFNEINQIPQPKFIVCESIVESYNALEKIDWKKGVVIKADGQAFGKGVFLPNTFEEAIEIVRKMMIERIFGEAGDKILLQEKLIGQEASLLYFCDGTRAIPMIPAQDYKRIFDGNKGPNTGGVGSYAPASYLPQELINEITDVVTEKVLKGMKNMGHEFRGILYVGLMLMKNNFKVLEFNTRFGDPETQVILPLLESDLLSIFESCIDGKLDKSLVRFKKESAVCVVLTTEGYPELSNAEEEIHGLNSPKILVFHAGTKNVGKKIITSGGRVLSVVGTGKNIEAARKNVYEVIGDKEIFFQRMHYRKDIGKDVAVNKVTDDKNFLVKNAEIPVARIEVNSIVSDMRAKVRRGQFLSQGFENIDQVFLTDVYTISKEMTSEQLQKIADVLTNPVSQVSQIIKHDSKITSRNLFSWIIEVGYLPGVTDNIANTVKEISSDLLNIVYENNEGVYSSQLTIIQGNISQSEIKKIAASLANPLIQKITIKSYEQFISDNGMGFDIPEVKLTDVPKVISVDLHVSDEELIFIGKQGILDDSKRRGPLALDLFFLQAIREYFDRKERSPTDVELESVAQTWSEHCKHIIFNDPLDDISDGLFNFYIKRATDEITKKQKDKKLIASAFTDNSGAIFFDENYLVSFKVETHNSPSALDPFGGAITGIVGVNRDALGFGLGAKPVANTFGFCFADPQNKTIYFRDKNLLDPLLTAQQIIDGVIAGVNSGGNCSGIPTPQGFIYFDDRFRGKPLVYVGTLGLIPQKNNHKILYKKGAQEEDLIVMVGGRVGLDGIHGATFSSEILDNSSPVSAVQIGDPITQKKLSDMLIKEARDQNLYTSITDNGAGGLSCSVAEMAKESNGCIVYLEKVPLKYPGLAPWQIWISESQERMTLAVPKDKWERFKSLCQRRDVEATVIGKFTNSGSCVVFYNGEQVMDVELNFLHDGFPRRNQSAIFPYTYHTEPQIPLEKNLTQNFIDFLSDLSISSFENISRQYDHEVQGGTVLKPLQGKGRINGDVTIVRPVLGSDRGVMLTQALYPGYSDIDTYHMAAASIDSAVRQIIASGGKLEHTALLDNFCWCDSTNPERLGQLKRAAEACYDYAIAYGTPFISGKDSMFNDFKGFDAAGNPVNISIPPTLLISALSIIADSKKAVSIDFKMAGDEIYILGETFDEIGASAYVSWWGNKQNKTEIGNSIPKVNASNNKKIYERLSNVIEDEIISSAISIGRGGLGVALAKSSMAGELGCEISLVDIPGLQTRADYALFSESQGRILVSIAADKVAEFEDAMKDLPCKRLGKVSSDQKIHILDKEKNSIVEASIMAAQSSYKFHFGILKNIAPKALVLTGYGINCEDESAFAIQKAGGLAEVVHVNDLIDGHKNFYDYEIVVFPGGFAFADDTGSGNAFALKLKNHMWENIQKYVEQDHLVIGLCNGFQILVNLGLLPGLDKKYGTREVALLHNDSAIYTTRWVDLEINGTNSPWLRNIKNLSLPIAHGEGRFYSTPETLEKLKKRNMIAAYYVKGEICEFQSLNANPNGSLENIAAITDETGRILGMMPHPERAIKFTHLPNWTYLKEKLIRQQKSLPENGPGLAIFQNAINYYA